MQRSTQHPRRRAWLRRLIVVAVLAAAVGALLSQTVFAQTSYIITDGDRVTVHRSYSSDPYEVLTEAGIELEEEDTYETGYADGMNQITVRRMQMVTVINRGAQSVIGTYGETTGSLLARMGITPGTGDTLSCSSETQTYDGMTIELVHTETRIEEEDTTVPYPVNYYEDPDLEPDAEIVLVAGQNGLTHVKSEVTYRNGKEVSRVIVQETVQTKPVTQLVIRGVDRTIMEQPADPEPAEQAAPDASSGTASGSSSSGSSSSGGSRYDGSAETSGNVIMTSSGESYTYVDVMTCSATAYTCEGYVGHTYSGTLARVGAIAVDPTVIPLGTKMYVVSNDGQYVYGYCVAEDIGGGIPNGRKFKAAQTGGPSGGCIPASLIDTPIDYDNLIAIGSMMGSGGLIVMDEDTCMVDLAKFFLEFTVDESCGKCAPCRIGTRRLLEILTKITDGKGELEDIDRLEELAAYIKSASLCGLGQTAPNPVLSTLRYFRDEYIAHVTEKRCPAGVCKHLLSYSILEDKCRGCTACARICPAGAISGSVKQPHKIDTSKCLKCGACIEKCKFGAIVKK
mgnify:CR=1 FL=1